MVMIDGANHSRRGGRSSETAGSPTLTGFSVNENGKRAEQAPQVWTGDRGSAKSPRPGTHQLYAFLTSEPNAVVRPIHPKAMPVILTTDEEIDVWLSAPWRGCEGAATSAR